MRLAIFGLDTNPTNGGSFGITQLISNHLLESRRPELDFVFVVPHDFKLLDGTEVIRLPSNFSFRLMRLLFLLHSGIQLKSIPWSKTAGKVLSAILKKHSIDLVWSISPLHVSLEIPFINTCWDLSHLTHPQYPELTDPSTVGPQRKLAKEALLNASLILVGTNVGKNDLVKYYQISSEKIFVNPFPADHTLISKGGNIRNEFQFFYPAQFWQHKNHKFLIQAFAKACKDSGLPLRLILSGGDKGEMQDCINLALELGVGEQIFFIGFVSKDELIHCYSSSRAMVFPNTVGPDNLPPLEAFKLGCPVIVAKSEGSLEQLGSNARYFSLDALDELSGLLISYASDPKYDENLILPAQALAEGRNVEKYVENVLQKSREFGLI